MFALEELQEQIAGELLTYAKEILRDHEEMTGVPLVDAEEMYEVLVQTEYPGLLARNAVRARDVDEFIELLEKDPHLIRAARAAQNAVFYELEDYDWDTMRLVLVLALSLV